LSPISPITTARSSLAAPVFVENAIKSLAPFLANFILEQKV